MRGKLSRELAMNNEDPENAFNEARALCAGNFRHWSRLTTVGKTIPSMRPALYARETPAQFPYFLVMRSVLIPFNEARALCAGNSDGCQVRFRRSRWFKSLQ